MLRVVVAVVRVLVLKLSQTHEELMITNNLTTAPVLPHVGQKPIGIDDQGGHRGDWRRLFDGGTLLIR